MSDDLKPCPFCGKPAKKYGTNVVGCTDQSVCCASVDWGHYTSSEGPEISWNARVADAERGRLAARIEELEKERDGWKDAATAHHPNPADHRYWEGRYRDEAARADALAALLREAEEAVVRTVEWMRANGYAHNQVDMENRAFLRRLEAREEIGKPPVHLGNQPAGDSQ